MNVLQMVQTARAAGVVFHLRDGLTVTLAAPEELRESWLSQLRPYRDDVRALLRIEEAEKALRTFAQTHGIPWPAARAQLTDADLLAGHESLQYAEATQSAPEFRMVQGWLSSLDGKPWKG